MPSKAHDWPSTNGLTIDAALRLPWRLQWFTRHCFHCFVWVLFSPWAHKSSQHYRSPAWAPDILTSFNTGPCHWSLALSDVTPWTPGPGPDAQLVQTLTPSLSIRCCHQQQTLVSAEPVLEIPIWKGKAETSSWRTPVNAQNLWCYGPDFCTAAFLGVEMSNRFFRSFMYIIAKGQRRKTSTSNVMCIPVWEKLVRSFHLKS